MGKCKNLSPGDIVLIKDSDIFTKRNGWPMARVEEVFPSADNLVRKHLSKEEKEKYNDRTTYMGIGGRPKEMHRKTQKIGG